MNRPEALACSMLVRVSLVPVDCRQSMDTIILIANHWIFSSDPTKAKGPQRVNVAALVHWDVPSGWKLNPNVPDSILVRQPLTHYVRFIRRCCYERKYSQPHQLFRFLSELFGAVIGHRHEYRLFFLCGVIFGVNAFHRLLSEFWV